MKQEKPKYNVFQNVAWMCGLAWKHRRRVLLFCALTALLEVLYNLVQLFLAPQILTLVEAGAALQALLGTNFLFTAALFALRFAKGYLSEIDLFARIDVRTVIIGLLGRKCNTTSYPNTLKPEFIKLRDVAHTASDGNQEATEQIWHTLTELCKNVGGFAVYLTILSHLDPILLLVTIATCLAGFWIARRTSGWMYRHRDEEEAYITRKRYIHRVAECRACASLQILDGGRFAGENSHRNHLARVSTDEQGDLRLLALGINFERLLGHEVIVEITRWHGLYRSLPHQFLGGDGTEVGDGAAIQFLHLGFALRLGLFQRRNIPKTMHGTA